MATRFLVIKETICDECSGNCVQTHPDWQKFFAEYHNFPNYWEDEEILTTYFKSLGHPGMPPEEIECESCCKGFIRSEVPLIEALQQIAMG